jgi:hypothetical protein
MHKCTQNQAVSNLTVAAKDNDCLQGGDGDDFLKSYENIYFLDSTDGFGFNPTPPSASSVVVGPGFGWQFSFQTPQNGIPVNLIQYELVNARVPDPSGQQDYLLQPIFYVDVNAESYEDGENILDGGDGNDTLNGDNFKTIMAHYKTLNKLPCNRKGHHCRIYQLKLVIHAQNPHGYWPAEHAIFNLKTQKPAANDAVYENSFERRAA